MFIRYGSDAAATATADATSTARFPGHLAARGRTSARSASVPAKPTPQASGICVARRMPAMDESCQTSQFVAATPKKKPSFPASASTVGYRSENRT